MLDLLFVVLILMLGCIPRSFLFNCTFITAADTLVQSIRGHTFSLESCGLFISPRLDLHQLILDNSLMAWRWHMISSLINTVPVGTFQNHLNLNQTKMQNLRFSSSCLGLVSFTSIKATFSLQNSNFILKYYFSLLLCFPLYVQLLLFWYCHSVYLVVFYVIQPTGKFTHSVSSMRFGSNTALGLKKPKAAVAAATSKRKGEIPTVCDPKNTKFVGSHGNNLITNPADVISGAKTSRRKSFTSSLVARPEVTFEKKHLLFLDYLFFIYLHLLILFPIFWDLRAWCVLYLPKYVLKYCGDILADIKSIHRCY